MKKITLIALLFLSSFSLFAQSLWQNDKMHSKLTFTAPHNGISDVAGLFKDFDVTIHSSQADFSDAVFELSVDVASINTEVAMRDNHLRSADFFDVAQFPKMTFKSTSIKKAGKNRYKLSGNLTLHGITKSVTMELWYRGSIEDPKTKNPIAGFQLTGTLKRSDFKVGPPAPMIGDDIQIRADGEFARK